MSKNYRTITITAAVFILAAAMVSVCFAQMRNITTQQLVRDMGNGINLGNTFESTCDWNAANCWINAANGVNAFETAWGSPTITAAMIKGYADAGFKTVRVPVSWSNLMTSNDITQSSSAYTISTLLLARVKQVVDLIRANNMYAIVNVHWDGGWWERFPADSANCMRKYTRIWEQVGTHFRDYNDYVMFESLNEEGKWQSVWDMYGSSTAGKARAYGILNAINQQFVNIIRGQGGNNANRHLLIAGYDTNIDRTIDAAFRMPNAPGTTTRDSRCAVSVHYYDPFGFTHLAKDEPWATVLMTWGTTQDQNNLANDMNKLKTNFVDKGVPVIIGEYGFACAGLDRGQAEIRKYTLAVAQAIADRNMLPVLWDVQLDTAKAKNERIYYYNRHTQTFPDAQLVAGFKAIFPATSVNNKVSASKAASARPAVTLNGRMLSVSSLSDKDFNVRIIDVKGKVRTSYKINGSGSFSLKEIPAGRYFVEMRGVDVRNTVPVVIR